MSELPKGWVSSVVSDLAKVESGVGFPKKHQGMETKDIPVYKVGDISRSVQAGKSSLSESSNYVDETVRLAMKGKLYPIGSTLFAKIGEALRLNRRGYVSLAGIADNNVMGVIPEALVDSKLMFYFLKTVDLSEFSRSSAVPSIRKGDVEDLSYPLAPLAEQKRIVEKLDEVLTQVDTIKARLDGIPDLLKRFRQSVLASAVSGKLTEEWRGQNDSKGFELSEFAKFWDQEYSKAGKKYSAPKIIEDSQVSSILPNSWLDTCVGKIFDVHVGATPSRKDPMYWGGDIPWVSSGEVAFSFITETNEKITQSGLSNSSTKIHPHGTVMLAMIGQGKTRGQPAILRIEAAHNQNTAALRVPEGMCVSEFLYYCLWEKYEETRRVGSGNNQKALNKSAVQNLHFPCPPYNEQKEIVRLIDQYFAFADTIEAQVNNAQARVDNLTQSILAKAFRGELVAQDPTDEPADKLLERIAKARAEAEALAKAAKKAEAAKKRAAKKATQA
ncbi:restriction endonuclease subunit S [Vibrio sp. 10N.247.311.12]|uniref:restriction endonuclease subunit S n=1 Tax=Vibrio sp. 10N.247.311.12 TaxID=3229991 RepID=UPI00354D0B12